MRSWLVLVIALGALVAATAPAIAREVPEQDDAPFGNLSPAAQAMLARALADGRLAGEVVIGGREAGSPLEATSIEGLRVEPASVTSERVDITVESASHAGRTILVTLDPALASVGGARVLVDGAPTAEAASLADALDATNDDGTSESFVLSPTQFLVSIPHFSAHTVTIDATSPRHAGIPASTGLAIILGLLTAAETIHLVRSNRRTRK